MLGIERSKVSVRGDLLAAWVGITEGYFVPLYGSYLLRPFPSGFNFIRQRSLAPRTFTVQRPLPTHAGLRRPEGRPVRGHRCPLAGPQRGRASSASPATRQRGASNAPSRRGHQQQPSSENFTARLQRVVVVVDARIHRQQMTRRWRTLPEPTTINVTQRSASLGSRLSGLAT